MGIPANDFRITQIPVAVGFFGNVIIPGNPLRRYLRFQAAQLGSIDLTPRMFDSIVIGPFRVPSGDWIDLKYNEHGPLVTSEWYQVEVTVNVLIVIESFYINQTVR